MLSFRRFPWIAAGAGVLTGIVVLLLIRAVLVASDLATEIQQQRVDTIRAACTGQNMRHDQTIKTLDLLIARAPRDKQAQANANRASTVLFINALAPKQNCAQVVRLATGK